MRLDVVLLAIPLILALAWLYRRDQRGSRRTRGAIFDDCRALLANAALSSDAAGYPVLTGTYKGRAVRLEALVDAVAVRKLPSLWVKVTLHAAVPYPAVFDLLMRPLNTEFYSPAGCLEYALATPESWPEHAVLRTDDPAGLPPLDLLAPHVVLFRDPKAKELVVAPRGLRLVYQVNEAERSYYLVLRQARFRVTKADPARIATLLDALIALHDDLAATAAPRLPAAAGAGRA
jgi:hypothetical protein